MRRVWWRYALVEIRLFFREWQYPFFVIAYPTLSMVLFGGIYSSSRVPGLTQYSYINVAMGGYVGLVIVATCNLMFVMKLLTYKELRIHLSYENALLSPWEINAIAMVTTAIFVFVSIIIMLIVGIAVYGVSVPHIGLLMIGIILSLSAMYAFATMLVSIFRSTRLSHAVTYIVFFIMLFLSGATIPLEVMGNVARDIALAVPLTYVVELLRASWIDIPASRIFLDCGVLVAIAVVSLVIAVGAGRNQKYVIEKN